MVLQLRNLSILSALCRALLRVCVDVLAFWNPGEKVVNLA